MDRFSRSDGYCHKSMISYSYQNPERVINMVFTEDVKTMEPSYTINDAMGVLLGKLDEAIDDMENGRVQTIEEAWEEIDKV